MYEQSSSESETPGPFSRSFQVLDQEVEEREGGRGGGREGDGGKRERGREGGG